MLDFGGEEHRNQNTHPVSPKNLETRVGQPRSVGSQDKPAVTLKMTTGHGPNFACGPRGGATFRGRDETLGNCPARPALGRLVRSPPRY